MGNEQPINDPFVTEVIYLMPPHVVAKLDESDRRELRKALSKGAQNSRHSVDIRLRLPLFFTGIYLVFQSGIDRRDRAQHVQRARGWISFASSSGLFLICSGFLICAFAVTYMAKCQLGINLFPYHLKDVIPSFLGGKA